MNITKIILISLILTTSCDSRVENKLTETFDDKITWNELDEFPSVKDCNNLNESYLIRECFESFLSNQILEKLDLSNVIINKPINKIGRNGDNLISIITESMSNCPGRGWGSIL